MRALAVLGILSALSAWTAAVPAATVNGSVTLGGIIMNQAGDRSTLQETYDVFDGFSLSQIRLDGTLAATDYFALDLREINLDSRQGDFVYRRPGLFKLTAGFDESRRVFSPDARVDARRKDWKLGAQYSPVKWLALSGGFNHQSRDGDRLPFPLGATSVLGNGYDNALSTGQVTAEVRRGRIGGALAYHVSDFSDRSHDFADRTGQVVSARFHATGLFYDKWTHVLRGAYGVRKLSSDDEIEHELSRFEYTGIVAPVDAFEFKYSFDASRVDDQALALETDRVQNDFDVTWFHRFGQVSGGYGYETNDDDRTLTHDHGWRAGAVLRHQKLVTARVDYAGRNKTDQEQLTLLKDLESSRFRARLQVQPIDALALGGGYVRREREFPDIGVEAEGDAANAFARYAHAGWGAVSVDYSYSTDTYHDLIAGFDSRSNIVIGRVDFERIENLRLAGGVTFLDIRRDLDIEKSMVFAEAAYRLQDHYRLEVKYNVYNYDDYILLDRYYTANVLRIDVGYDFSVK